MYRFKVPAMHCGGCARRVRAALQALDPSAMVETDVAGREVAVESAFGAAALAEALATAGYPPGQPAD